MRKARLVLIAALLLGLAFSWGFLSHRYEVFPYGLIKALVVGDEPTDVPLLSRRAKTGSLLSLPYASATRAADPELKGVIHLDEKRSQPGLNLYNSDREPRAFLISETGEVLHRWQYGDTRWHYVYLFPDGDVLVILENERLLRLDKDSQLEWEQTGEFHHDLWVDESSGHILTLERQKGPDPGIHPSYPIAVDTITVLSADGTIERRIDLLASLRRSPWRALLPSVNDRHDFGTDSPVLEIFHTNTIERITTRHDRLPPAFRPGNLIVSIRNLNAVVVLDPESEELEWLWGPNNIINQHHPTLLDDGNLLLFDNGREESRVIELDPATRKIVWRYGPVDGFFSHVRGSNQRLANGNTLITESDEGRVFEVTPDGEIVWEFLNHDVDEEGNRGPIYRLHRYPREYVTFLPDT